MFRLRPTIHRLRWFLGETTVNDPGTAVSHPVPAALKYIPPAGPLRHSIPWPPPGCLFLSPSSSQRPPPSYPTTGTSTFYIYVVHPPSTYALRFFYIYAPSASEGASCLLLYSKTKSFSLALNFYQTPTRAPQRQEFPINSKR